MNWRNGITRPCNRPPSAAADGPICSAYHEEESR